MSEIKRCPLCNGEASTFKKQVGWLHSTGNIYEYGVMCNTPNCCIIPAKYDSEKEAIKRWNTRKPMERILTRLEEEVISLEDNYGEEVLCIPKDIVLEIVKEEGGIE